MALSGCISTVVAELILQISPDPLNASPRAVLSHPRGIQFFETFCQSEFSTENINFWKRCLSFRQLGWDYEGEAKRTGKKSPTSMLRDQVKLAGFCEDLLFGS